MPTPICTICSHPKVDEIHQALLEGTPYAQIPRLFNDDFKYFTLVRHVSKHLQTSHSKIVENQRIKEAVGVDRRFGLLLDNAEEVMAAARQLLLVNGELNFDPRAWEINVVYEDYNDTNREGDPKLKTAPLDELLARLDGEGFRHRRAVIRNEDARKGYREAIAQAESIIDRFAKLFGAYQQDRSNDANELTAIRNTIMKTSLELGTTYDIELHRFLALFGDQLRPDLRGMLVKESQGTDGGEAAGGRERKALPPSSSSFQNKKPTPKISGKKVGRRMLMRKK